MHKNHTSISPRLAFSVVDLENLCGGSHKVGTYGRMIRNWVSQVTKTMGYSQASTQVVAAGVNALEQDPHLQTYWHGSEFLIGHGMDGADKQLLDVLRTDPRVQTCDEILLFSGDHCFVDPVRQLRRMGVAVTGISWNGCMSRELEEAASRVFKFELPRRCAIKRSRPSQTWVPAKPRDAHVAV